MREILSEWRELDTSRPALKKFGWTVGAVLLGLAAFSAWKHDGTLTTAATVLVALGGALVVLGTVAPVLLRPVYQAWMGIAVVMGFVMTRVILTVVFFLVATPLGLVRRLLGHDPMRRRRVDGTMWIKRDPDEDVRRNMERTF